MEIKSEGCIFSFIVFNHTFQYANMERHMLPVDRKKYRIIFIVNVNKLRFKIFWQIVLAFIALNFITLNSFLFLEIPTKILITSFLQLLQFLSFQNHLMFCSFFLIFKFFICFILNLTSSSLNNVTIIAGFRFTVFFSFIFIFQRV